MASSGPPHEIKTGLGLGLVHVIVALPRGYFDFYPRLRIVLAVDSILRGTKVKPRSMD